MKKSSRRAALAKAPAQCCTAEHLEQRDPVKTAALLQRPVPHPHRQRLAIILGTGLGGALAHLEEQTTVSYVDLPGFRAPGAEGHAGHLAGGLLSGKPVAVLAGRSHYQEGLEMAELTFPARVGAQMPQE